MKMINCISKKKYKKVVKIVSGISFVSYLLYLFYLVFLSHSYGRGYSHRSYNLIPFETISLFITSSLSLNVILINVVGNIVAFLPMGFFIPVLFDGFKNIKKVVLISFLATLTIEITQYIMMLGAFDIDDLMLNTLGGILGYSMYRLSLKVFKVGFYDGIN